MTKGWHGDRMQHGLASKGIKTVSGNFIRDKKYDKIVNYEPKSLQDLAGFYEGFFFKKKRDDGEEFWLVKDDAPEELKTLIQEAHEDMFPDDYKYQFIREALTDFSSYEDPDEVIDYIEADPYTTGLTHWLSSNINRVYYLTEAIEQFEPKDGFQALTMAQYEEKREVYSSVQNSLEKNMDEYKEE